MAMVQYGLWGNCCNDCDFCLRLERRDYSPTQQIEWIRNVAENIKVLDVNKFNHGISLLGGELFYIQNKEVQSEFLTLIDTVIDFIIRSGDPQCKFSTVTNGLYDPTFLYQVVDRLKEGVGLNHIDVNFSYDFKYRYKTEKLRVKALTNIQAFRDRYDYRVGVQMILTQHLIDLWDKGEFDLNHWLDTDIKGCNFCFLYPHPINTGRVLPDFNFKRKDFLTFISWLKNANFQIYWNFINSTKNSGTFKYTGMRYRADGYRTDQIPILSDGKEVISPCGHSQLYRCYSDSDKCVLCDLESIEGEF